MAVLVLAAAFLLPYLSVSSRSARASSSQWLSDIDNHLYFLFIAYSFFPASFVVRISHIESLSLWLLSFFALLGWEVNYSALRIIFNPKKRPEILSKSENSTFRMRKLKSYLGRGGVVQVVERHFIHTYRDRDIHIFRPFPEIRNCECKCECSIFQSCPRIAQRRLRTSSTRPIARRHNFLFAYILFIPNPPAKFLLLVWTQSRSFPPLVVSPSSSILYYPLVSMTFVYMDAKCIGWTAFQSVCLCNIITNRKGMFGVCRPRTSILEH